jgi:hypothetical protein
VRLKPLGHLSIPTKKFTGNIATEFRGTKSADLSADRGRNHSAQISLFHQTRKEVKQEDVMGRGLLLWLLGIPIPIIILIWVLGGLHG